MRLKIAIFKIGLIIALIAVASYLLAGSPRTKEASRLIERGVGFGLRSKAVEAGYFIAQAKLFLPFDERIARFQKALKKSDQDLDRLLLFLNLVKTDSQLDPNLKVEAEKVEALVVQALEREENLFQEVSKARLLLEKNQPLLGWLVLERSVEERAPTIRDFFSLKAELALSIANNQAIGSQDEKLWLERAKDQFEQALIIDPISRPILSRLIGLLERLGEKDLARPLKDRQAALEAAQTAGEN